MKYQGNKAKIANEILPIMLDNYKIKSLGWKVNTNIASGIEKTVQQYIDLVYKKQFSDKISIF